MNVTLFLFQIIWVQLLSVVLLRTEWAFFITFSDFGWALLLLVSHSMIDPSLEPEANTTERNTAS